MLGGIALVHAEQVGGEQRRLVAAGAGADFQDGVLLVGRVLGQQHALHAAARARAGASSAPRASSSAIAFISGSAAHRLGVLAARARPCASSPMRLDQRARGRHIPSRPRRTSAESSVPADSAACSSAWRARRSGRVSATATRRSQPFSASAKASRAPLRAASPLSRSLSCGHALGELVVADDDGGAGVEPVGALHAPLHVAAIVHARRRCRARRSAAGDAERLGLGGRAQRRDHDRPRQRPAARCTACSAARCRRPSRRRRSAARPARRSARHSGRRPAPCPARRCAW